jgi:ribose transport system permease protein
MRMGLSRATWLPLLGVILVGSAALGVYDNSFLSSPNISVILSDAAIIFLIGASQVVVLSVREFNLAVGSIGALTGIALGYLLTSTSMPLLLAVGVALIVAAACGLVNGLIVAWSKVNGFIVTLAMSGVFSGIAFGTTSARAYTGFPQKFLTFGGGGLGFLPYVAMASAAVAVALGIFYRWARPGRAFLAVGGSREAAELCGIIAGRVVVKAYVLSGLLAGLAAVLVVARDQSARPVTGADWLIESFVVPVVGGTSLDGGVVSVAGAVVGALLLAAINNCLVVLNVNAYWVTTINGLVIFVAVLLGRSQLRRSLRRAEPDQRDQPVDPAAGEAGTPASQATRNEQGFPAATEGKRG